MSDKKISWECEHCNKGFLSNLEKAEEHRKECPNQFSDPKKRFDARLEIEKRKKDKSS